MAQEAQRLGDGGSDVPLSGSARFDWDYDEGRGALLALYERGKERQWSVEGRIDWSLDVDPEDPLDMPAHTNPLRGSSLWDRLSEQQRKASGGAGATWQLSQFLHGEQAAMICSSTIVATVPDLDAKLYAATQVVDEARHAEVYSRFLREKVGRVLPVDPSFATLVDQTLTDSRWDMPYLGMQVLVEGLALAAFGMIREQTRQPLVRQIMAAIMADEARHVAFGRLVLREYYAQLSDRERRDREEFVAEGCWLMRDRLLADAAWEEIGLSLPEARAAVEESGYVREFRRMLFSRIVPCVRDIGLWGPRVRESFAGMGIEGAERIDLAALLHDDEQIAEQEAREVEQRRREVAEVVELGRASA